MNKTVNLSFDFDKEIIQDIKDSSFSSRWNDEFHEWIIPVDSYTKSRIKNIISKYGFIQVVKKKEDDVEFSYEKKEVDIAYLKGLCDAKRFTYTPRNYQLEALGYALEKGNLINADAVGCISGDALIDISYKGGFYKMKLSDLKNIGNYDNVKTLSYDELNGDFVWNDIENVIYSGIKPVIKVRLSSGLTLELTHDHEVYSKQYGWREISKFKSGEKIVSINKSSSIEDEIVFIYSSGYRHTYDIVMKDPHRSFVANKILVHNCGKTFESILYAEITDSFPCLVITPASVKYNWKEKWEEITGNKRSVSAIESKETKSRKNNWNDEVVVINYDIVGKKQGKGATVRFNELKEIPWKMVIFDEAHFLKNKTSQRALASKMITKPKDLKIQLLTGTAIKSKPVEIWNLLVIAKLDKYIAKDWHQFISRYCGGYRGKFGWVTDGATNMLELNRRLRETGYIRRESEEVMPEMPKISIQIIKATITNKREVDKATSDLIDYVRTTKGEEDADKAMEAEHLVRLTVLRKLAIEGKRKFIEQYLNDWKNGSEEKLLIFGVHKELLKELSLKYKCDLIAGGVSSKKKFDIVKGWQTNDKQFLFANMESAGTGTDGLQNVCFNMLITELPWCPSDLEQVIGRLKRSGQTKTPNINYMLSFDTIDAEMWDMLSAKQLVTESVNKGVDIRRNKSGMKEVLKKLLKK